MELKRYLRVVASTGDDDDDYSMVEISNRRAREAADRIEKLEMAARGVPLRDMAALSKALDRIEKLEAALRKYADEEYNGYNADGAHARNALEGKDD